MVDRHFLDSFLKLNHTSEQMSEGEVTTILTNAGWKQSEIDSALILLRNGGTDGEPENTPTSALARTFRPELEFSGAQLSDLLGVDVVLDPEVMNGEGASTQVKDTLFSIVIGIAICVLSLGLAIGIAVASAHFLELDLSPLML